MNNSIKMSVVSATLGALLAGAIFVSMAQTTVGTPTRIQYIPHPRDMVQIIGTQAYVVPAGKILTVTGVGRGSMVGSSSVELQVNGATVVSSLHLLVSGGMGFAIASNISSVTPMPSGVTVAAGNTVTLIDSQQGGATPDLLALGYLVSQ